MPTLFKQLQTARDHEPPAPVSPVPDKGSSKSSSSGRKVSRASQARVEARKEFLKVTTKGTRDEAYTNPESLPPLDDAYNNFQHIYPKFAETWAVDDLREREYFHLEEGEHVCMDYCGFGLFSYYQQVLNKASSSFGLAYISANLPTHALYGAAEEGTAEAYIRKRVMDYLNVSDREYSMVFTASRGSAFKLLAESYPFHLNQRLLTVYDFESEAVNWMGDCAKQKGAKIMSACFKWPSLRVGTSDLKKQLQEKKKKGESAKGLFVFPVQSRMTGAKYSYQWMSQAQQNKWHVLLDASALGPKDMDSLGLSLFRPDFIVSSFYKVFGTDPTGFGCLFIKKSALHSLHNSSRARAVGMVRIVSISKNPTDGPEEREAEDEDFQQSAWQLDQQARMSSFSGPVSSFYAEADAKKLKSFVNQDNNYHAASKLPKSNGRRVGEIENSGQLRRVIEIEEEAYADEIHSGRFSGRLSSGYHNRQMGGIEQMNEVEYSGEFNKSRYDLDSERRGRRSSEIEEVVPKSGLITRPRSSFGSSSGEIEEVMEQKPRRISLREQLHEPQTSPLKTVSQILHEDDDPLTASSSARFYSAPPRRSYRMDDHDDDDELSQTPVINDRRAGDSDDSGGEDYEDCRDSSFRNGRMGGARGQYDLSPDVGVYSGSTSDDRFDSNLDTSLIEEEIEEREFSRTALSDIEEEKGEGEGEGEDTVWDQSDYDDRGAEQRSGLEATERGIAYSGEFRTGMGHAPAAAHEIEDVRKIEDAEEKAERVKNVQPQPVMAEKRNVEPPAVAQKETRTVEGIKARLARFVGRASFRRHSGKETSDSKEFGVKRPVNKIQSLDSGKGQREEAEGNLQPKSDAPLNKHQAPLAQPEFLAQEASDVSEGTSSEARKNANGDVKSGGLSPALPTPEKIHESVGQASGSDSEAEPAASKEIVRPSVQDGASSKASKVVPASFDAGEEVHSEFSEQCSPRDLPAHPLDNAASPDTSEDGATSESKAAIIDSGNRRTPATGPSSNFSHVDGRSNQTEDDEGLWNGPEELRRSGRWSPDQAAPAGSPRDGSMDDELDSRPADSSLCAPQSTNVAAQALQHALLFRADGGGTPYESGEENYITILPGSRSGKNWDRIPEPVNESPDSARQRDSKSSLEELPDTPSPSPAVGKGMDKQVSTDASPVEVAESSEVWERPRSSGQDDTEKAFDTSPQSPRSEYSESRRGANSTALYLRATPRSSASTPNNATSSYQTERSITEDLSFDEADFHDSKDQRGMNGSSDDLRSGRTLSRDVDLDENMFTSSTRRNTLAEDLARVDLQDSDDESFYQAQYDRDSYHGSSTSRYFGEDAAPSACYQEEESDDDFEEGEEVGNGDLRQPKIVCKGLDLADSLGLTKTNYRLRYLINWLVNSLLTLRHPSPNDRGTALVRIYGPKVKYDRGAAVSFNLFDWKGVFIQPGLVQRLADRSNISLGVGRLCNIVDPDLSPDFLAEKERWGGTERSDHGKEGTPYCAGRSDGGKSSSAGKWDSLTIPVVTAAMGFVTNFEDVYRLWAFLAKFLDADFVSKEVWRYHSLNQQTVVV
ncbi:hypothetical protein MPTK1_5g11010 [Marchantia polymorpha subsp. ruderalis]|uniref:Aminotransferase class V domain-containing protein n=2 Tax=Marchantia polymorpha TaxID=3197 RepID=A0A176VD07_MARPO|nr:hypothetical protein AXG93_2396s1050 [Marchantia polymorpha subsp. ruderalis]PTQ32940.1 hypothetical protein MARPO_0093s0023 [Marchantia polymorpha]BBN11332.1 hypothetical protein Mp_5g11010 [Marchantia polymorpha subsp. ruderalis]|eukprot:PTQ32940.1 hypothetical protein MARPO_0093s0023 [Marchantia polymorpha]